MSESQILYLREVDNLVDDFTIKVRILHIWTMKDKKKNEEIYSRDMVIMDEEGSKCHASVQTKFFQRFHELLTVGSTVLIRRPTISENKSVFKIGKMKINFYYKTTVAVAPDFSGSLYGFSFNTFDSIISSSYSSEFSIDLIGEIVHVGPMIPSAGPTIQNRMEIRIQNLDALQIRVTLWGSFADKMAEFSNNSENRGRVIFIIQFARLNVYNGHVSVTSYFDVTKLFINTDIEEINHFRDLLVDKRGERDSSSTLTYQSGKLYSAEEDFLVNTEFKTIDEVLEPLEINKYVIVGTIYGIRQDFTWFYLSCKNCTHLATESKGVNTSNNGLDVRNKPPVYTCDSDSCVNMTIEVVPTLSAAIRSSGNIVLNVASSGIASLLLTGGRTAHSRFGIPINLTEDSVCYTTPNSEVGCLLKNTKLIIWDEAPMTHKHAFEALDRCLKDIMKADDSRNAKILFGGKTIVFGGDFRQVLPVIPNGSRQDIVNASLCSSHIWSECKVLKLTKNMRLTIGSDSSDHEETMIFAQWLLNIGEGKLGGPNDGDAVIDIPEDILITTTDDPLSSLFDFVYPSILENYNLDNYFQDRAILAPTNEIVSEINDRFLSIFPGEEKEYLSSDSLCATEDLDNQFDPSLYSPDVLNGLKISGLPHHRLVLKIGVPIMLLRNIDQKMCLCNGTRLKVLALGKRVIEAEIISGGNIGYRAFIPRIALSPSDVKIPFKFQRRQFPIAVCFSMTINKSQGQSLSKVGLFLRQPVFSHGQLYVALSRVKSRKGLKILILDNDKNVVNKTRNVVFKEIFSNL